MTYIPASHQLPAPRNEWVFRFYDPTTGRAISNSVKWVMSDNAFSAVMTAHRHGWRMLPQSWDVENRICGVHVRDLNPEYAADVRRDTANLHRVGAFA